MAMSVIDGSLANTRIKAIAGGAITAGDLLVNYETGYVNKVNSILGVQLENNNTAGASAVKAAASIEGSANYGEATSDYHTKSICELANGNIAFIYTGDGSSPITNLNLRIKNTLDGDVVAKVIVTPDVMGGGFKKVLKISATQFAVVWVNSSNALKFQIFNNDGTTSGSTVTVDSLGSGAFSAANVAALTNGNLVFAYNQVTTTHSVFKIYSAAGAVVVAATTISASDAATCFAVLGCSNGDFVVMFRRGTATAAVKVARYSSAGASVGSIQSAANYYGAAYTNHSDTLIELTNGNVVALCADTASYPSIIVLSNTHAVVKGFASLATSNSVFVSSQSPSICALPTGGFAIIGRNASYPDRLTLMTFDGLGKSILTKLDAGAASVSWITTGSGSTEIAFPIGAIGFIVMRVQYDGASNWNAYLQVINSQGIAVGSIVALRINASSLYWSSAILTSNNIFVGMIKENSGNLLQNFYYNCIRKSIVGVSADTVSAGGAVNIGTKGNFTINQSLSNGGNFDNTQAATVVAGCKGSVIGNTAILRGTA